MSPRWRLDRQRQIERWLGGAWDDSVNHALFRRITYDGVRYIVSVAKERSSESWGWCIKYPDGSEEFNGGSRYQWEYDTQEEAKVAMCDHLADELGL